MSVVVSVRIPKEVKEILEEEGINVAEEVRKYLEELAIKVRLRRYLSKWDKLLENAKPSEPGFSVRSVREDRESR